jgi:LuxR family maltose regulon positive regulatory protein
MTASLLLPTKLTPPTVRQRLVRRRRLVEHLEAAPAGALTLIAAPAGFGKTSLLADWLASASGSVPIAWVTLDEGDNDPGRFWAYVVAALQRIEPGLGLGMLTLLRDRAPVPPETLLAGLIGELAALPHRISLVLDDYQAIETSAIHVALGFLLDHLPTQLQLDISTRADPPLPLARLRARGQLLEIRASDLRLTADEAVAFLTDTMGLALAPDTATVLVGRSEGWAAGLQLAALATQGRADPDSFVRTFAGSHRFVLDYLVAKVLSRLPEPVQGFLLRTAILNRLSAPLCDVLLAEDGLADEVVPAEAAPASGLEPSASPSQVMLEELERANLLLIPLDDERRWYRYHHLFADALRHRLRLTLPGLISELHTRASDWYADAGLSAEAVEHALLGGSWERAAGLIRPLSRPLFEQGLHATLHRWLVSLPAHVRRALPSFNFGRCLSLLLMGQIEAAESLLDTAEAELSTGDNLIALAEMYLLRAALAVSRSETARAIGFAEQSLEHLPIDDTLPRAPTALTLAQAYLQAGRLADAERLLAEGQALAEHDHRVVASWIAQNVSASFDTHRGQLRRAADGYRSALDRMGTRPIFPCVGSVIGLAGIQRERNELDTAAAGFREGLGLGEKIGLGRYLGPQRIEFARVLRARGDHEEAAAALGLAEQSARELGSAPLVRQARAQRARLWLAQGDLAGAVHWADTEAPSLDDLEAFERSSEALILARVRIAQGEPGSVVGLVAHLLAFADDQGAAGIAIEILAVQALALDKLGDRSAALEGLARAVTLAEPEEYARVFVDEGPPMADLLRQLLGRRMQSRYIGRLLRAFGDPAVATTPAALLPEPPSEREREVLGLLAEGLSNRAIAERLVIAENTVKAHVHHLGGKLGATSRTQVLARARELGLL